MMDELQFRVGDKVALISRGWAAPELYRVARVLKRFVELDDGSRWTHLGGPYPRDSLCFMHIRPWTPQHERECLVAQAATTARNIFERLNERSPNVAEAAPLVDELQKLLDRLK